MDNKRKYNLECNESERNSKLQKRGTNTFCSPKAFNQNQNIFKTFEPFKIVKTSRKAALLSNLVKDLDEFLDEETGGESDKPVGEETLAQCRGLRASLQSYKQQLIPEISQSSPKSPILLNELSKLPKAISPLCLSPWKHSNIPNEYPSLPEILDSTLEAATFIHSSAGAGHPGALNYEQLELIGDAYMELIATLLISQTFPNLSPGKQCQIREMLVKNITLANYSLHYKFDKRLKMDWALLQSTSITKVKVLGDVFEAYVAAVILSDPLDGVRRVSQWLKDLWGITIATTILQEEKSEFKTSSYLWQLRGNIPPDKVAEAFNNRPVELNAKEKLQKLIGGKHAKLSYKETAPPLKDPATKLAVFSIGVYLDGWGEKDKLLGSGKANGKKEAGLHAATAALKNEKLIQTYAAQKIALRGT
ncbi:hypothetical protein K3495_g6125 [Podosphaera aphanis]|nr:hypothetical protein K3495_g6125 [Podosphaera aphanis]